MIKKCNVGRYVWMQPVDSSDDVDLILRRCVSRCGLYKYVYVYSVLKYRRLYLLVTYSDDVHHMYVFDEFFRYTLARLSGVSTENIFLYTYEGGC